MNNRKYRIRLSAVAVLVALSVSLAGCRGSERRYMTISVPRETVRTVRPLELEAAPDSEAPAEAPPPPVEVSLTIEECRALALEHNLDLAAALIDPSIAAQGISREEARFEALFFAEAQFAKTDEAVASTLSSAMAESFTGDLGVSIPLRTGGTLSFEAPSSRLKTSNAFATLNPSYTTDFSASITQPLLRGAGFRSNTHAIRLARYEAMKSEARTKLEVIRVIAAADRVYWRLCAARRELDVRREEHDLAVALLESARRRVETGEAAEVEIVRAETGVAERLEAIILAETDVRLRERELKRTVNAPDVAMGESTVLIPTSEPTLVRYALDAGKLVAAALDNRMELLELELQLAGDVSSVAFQRNAALPLVNIGYTYRVNALGASSDDAVDLLFDKRFEDHVVGLSVEVPLGNKAARSRLQEALLTRARTLATREGRRLQIEQEVLDALDQLESSWQRVLANRQRTILAARNAEAEKRQFEQGLRTSTDVLDAQARLANAQSAEVDSLAEYRIAQVDLAFATGTLLGAAKVDWEQRETAAAASR